jgi:DNA-directed RNA polymerase subunit RPC12/RpoP
MNLDYWPADQPPEVLAHADAYIEASAEAYDSILPGLGDALRAVWADVRPAPSCDCPMDPYHRWNCALTPIWAQTMRDLDINPWTVVRNVLDQSPMPTECPICGSFEWSKFLVPQYDDAICIECWQRNRHREPELWHCADCGKFLGGWDRMVLQVSVRDGAAFLCRTHFDARRAAIKETNA